MKRWTYAPKKVKRRQGQLQVTPLLIREGNPRGVAWLGYGELGRAGRTGKMGTDRVILTNTTPPHRNVSAFAFASHHNTNTTNPVQTFSPASLCPLLTPGYSVLSLSPGVLLLRAGSGFFGLAGGAGLTGGG
jgi:hypothetical protein